MTRPSGEVGGVLRHDSIPASADGAPYHPSRLSRSRNCRRGSSSNTMEPSGSSAGSQSSAGWSVSSEGAGFRRHPPEVQIAAAAGREDHPFPVLGVGRLAVGAGAAGEPTVAGIRAERDLAQVHGGGLRLYPQSRIVHAVEGLDDLRMPEKRRASASKLWRTMRDPPPWRGVSPREKA